MPNIDPDNLSPREQLIYEYYIKQDLTAREVSKIIGITAGSILGIAARRGWKKRVYSPTAEPLPFVLKPGAKPCRIDRMSVYNMWKADPTDEGVRAIAVKFDTTFGTIARILDLMGQRPRKRIRRTGRTQHATPLSEANPTITPILDLPPPSPAMAALAEFDPVVHRCYAMRLGIPHVPTLRESWDLNITSVSGAKKRRGIISPA